MAETEQGMKDVDSYTIVGTTKIVRVGDCVLMRPSDTDRQTCVALVENMETYERGSVRVRVQWYYRPEEIKEGRRTFHGAKELFLSDQRDTVRAHAIKSKCIVRSLREYIKLNNVGPEDFFCRFEYKTASGTFYPDIVAVYCKCEMPYNPDHFMVKCDECMGRYHPECVAMTTEHAKKVGHFTCSDCDKNNGVKGPSNANGPNFETEGGGDENVD